MTPPMRAKGVIVAMAIMVLGLAAQVSGLPQEVPEVVADGEGKYQVLLPDNFDLAQTEAAQTEASPTDRITEAEPEGTEESETNTDQIDLIGVFEDESSGTEVSEASPNGTDVPKAMPSEIDVAETSPSGDEIPESDPNETEMPEANVSETHVPESLPSATGVYENTPSEIGETETGPDQTNMTETKPNTTESNPSGTAANPTEIDKTEGKPGETDIPVPKPSKTDATGSETESEPSETDTNKAKPTETVTKPSDATSTNTNPDQTNVENSVTDRTTSARPTQTTARPIQTTRRPTLATKRPSQVGGSGGFPLPAARPGSLAGSGPNRITGTSEIQQNTTTCRKPGVEYPIGITFEELRAALEKARVLLIDVRQPWELRETGRLPWSNNLPLHELEEAVKLSENTFMERYGFPKPMPEDDNVVLTCRSGRRARQAWYLLEPYGYCSVKVYFGSYLDWKSKGGPLLPVPPARRP